jgi:hypothetical protein
LLGSIIFVTLFHWKNHDAIIDWSISLY